MVVSETFQLNAVSLRVTPVRVTTVRVTPVCLEYVGSYQNAQSFSLMLWQFMMRITRWSGTCFVL